MQLTKSNYTDGLFFLGYDDTISESVIVNKLRADFGLQDGSDFNGLDRRDCDVTDTHTEDDLDTVSEMINSYDTVERVYLRAAR